MASSVIGVDLVSEVVNTIRSGWDTSIIAKPVVKPIYDVGARVSVARTNYVLVYEVSRSTTYPYLPYQHADHSSLIRIDVRTDTRTKLSKLSQALFDVLGKNRVRPTTNISYWEIVKWNDLSDRMKKLYRRVIDLRVIQLAVPLE